MMRLKNISLRGWTHFASPSFIGRHLGGSHSSAVVNSAAVNMGVQTSLQDPAFHSSGKYPEVGLLDRMVVLFLTFGGTSTLFSIAAAPFPIPTSSARGSDLHILASTGHFVFISESSPAGCEVVPVEFFAVVADI